MCSGNCHTDRQLTKHWRSKEGLWIDWLGPRIVKILRYNLSQFGPFYFGLLADHLAVKILFLYNNIILHIYQTTGVVKYPKNISLLWGRIKEVQKCVCATHEGVFWHEGKISVLQLTCRFLHCDRSLLQIHGFAIFRQ